MKRRGFSIGWMSALALAFVCMVSLALPDSAAAFGSRYFSNGDAEDPADIWNWVGYTPYVRESNVSVAAYFDSSTGRIQVPFYNYCPGRAGDNDAGVSSSVSTSANITLYRFFYTNTNGTPNNTTDDYPERIDRFGHKRSTATDCSADIDLTLKNIRQDAETGEYKVGISVSHVAAKTDFTNTFVIKSPTTGALIAHTASPTTNGSNVTVEQVNTDPRNTNYSIKFGADCEVDNNERTKIKLYDLDGLGGSGAQKYEDIKIVLKEDGDPIRIRTTLEPNNSDPGSGGQFEVEPEAAASDKDQYVWFTAKPGKKYELIIKNVYWNNTIQFNTPYDGIFWAKKCQKAKATAGIQLRKQCGGDRTINWRPSGRVIDSNDPRGSGVHADNDDVALLMTANSGTCVEWRGRAANPGDVGWTGDANVKGYVSSKTGNYDPATGKITWDSGSTVDSSVKKSLSANRAASSAWDWYYSRTIAAQQAEFREGTSPSYVLPSTDNKVYCRRYNVTPSNSTDPDSLNRTKWACVRVLPGQVAPIMPNIGLDGSDDDSYSYYPQIQVKGWMDQTSGAINPTPWSIYMVRVPVGAATPTSPTPVTDVDADDEPISRGTPKTLDDACAEPNFAMAAPAGAEGCREIATANGPASWSESTMFSDTDSSDPPGTKRCFFARVRNPNKVPGNPAEYYYSDIVCSVSGVLPQVQVKGYDARVGESIVTSTSQLLSGASLKTFGSFGEYGVLSNGPNFGMGSGNTLKSGINPAATSPNPLTFGNVNDEFGHFGGIVQPSKSVNPTQTITGDAQFPADLGFGVPMGANAKAVVLVEGTLRITSDIRYANGPYTSIRQIPNLIIVANDIVIDPAVGQIDAWIIANRISTCSAVGDGGPIDDGDFVPFTDEKLLSTGMCSSQLRFNGPVITDSIYLYRTSSSPTAPVTAAELFNLRASNFLSAYSGGGTTKPIATTDLVTELPPRF